MLWGHMKKQKYTQLRKGSPLPPPVGCSEKFKSKHSSLTYSGSLVQNSGLRMQNDWLSLLIDCVLD